MPDCRAISLTDENEPVPLFSVVTGPNKLPVSLICRTGLTNTFPRSLTVKYAGRNLYLIQDGTTDTVLYAKLDECGRPVTSIYVEQPGFEPLHTRYHYNIQGRLSKYVWSGPLGGTHTLEYDHRGNVLNMTGEPNSDRYLYTYDYSKPVEKGVMYTVELRGWATEPLSFLEWLGHLDLRPRNLRTSSESWSADYHMETLTYSNYTFNGNKVYSYATHGGARKFVIGWDCKGGGGAK